MPADMAIFRPTFQDPDLCLQLPTRNLHPSTTQAPQTQDGAILTTTKPAPPLGFHISVNGITIHFMASTKKQASSTPSFH